MLDFYGNFVGKYTIFPWILSDISELGTSRLDDDMMSGELSVTKKAVSNAQRPRFLPVVKTPALEAYLPSKKSL